MPKLHASPCCRPSPSTRTTVPPLAGPPVGSRPPTRTSRPAARASSPAATRSGAAPASGACGVSCGGEGSGSSASPGCPAPGSYVNSAPGAQTWAFKAEPTDTRPGTCAGARHSRDRASSRRPATGPKVPTRQCTPLTSPATPPRTSSTAPPPSPPLAGATAGGPPSSLQESSRCCCSRLPTTSRTSAAGSSASGATSHTSRAEDARRAGSSPAPAARHRPSLPSRLRPDTCTRVAPPRQAARGAALCTCAASRYRNTGPSELGTPLRLTPTKPAAPGGIVHRAPAPSVASAFILCPEMMQSVPWSG